MLILRTVKGVRKLESFILCKYVNTRFHSVECEVSRKNTEAITRKYLKPLSTEESKQSLNDNFIGSLYAGAVDKNLFEYPTVLREEDLDVVINHSASVERFLQDAPKKQLNEDTLKSLKKLELFGLSIPQKYGGAGYNETECKFLQECTGTNPTIARFLGYNENFGCKILNLYGNEEQKEKYLPRLARGEIFISFAYLENGPLIDFSKIEGYALKHETNNCYILSAEKKWVHNADKADLFLVLVKLPEFLDYDGQVKINFSIFIVERNTPGLTVHKLKSAYAEENHLFEVSLNDVVVQDENLLGNAETNGYEVLKTAFSHNNVTDATVCCNIIKHISFDAMQFIRENNLHNPPVNVSVNVSPVNGYGLIQENLASLVIYLYALESVIYLVTARFDMYERPNLFNESVLAKSLAIDILKVAIKKYTEILGRTSFKSELLEEALKAVQYYSVYDENIEYLKMMISAEGFTHAGRKLTQKVKIAHRPFDNYMKVFQHISFKKEKHNFKLELQEALSRAGDIFEETFEEFKNNLTDFFLEHGRETIQNEHAIVKFGDMATYIYAAIATLSRASSSLCYDLPDCKNELGLAQAFTFIAHTKVRELCDHDVKYSNICQYYVELGKEIFNRKEYPVEHPLWRTY